MWRVSGHASGMDPGGRKIPCSSIVQQASELKAPHSRTFHSIQSYKEVKTWARQGVPGLRRGVEEGQAPGEHGRRPHCHLRWVPQAERTLHPHLESHGVGDSQKYPQRQLGLVGPVAPQAMGARCHTQSGQEEAEVGCKTQAGRRSADASAWGPPRLPPLLNRAPA